MLFVVAGFEDDEEEDFFELNSRDEFIDLEVDLDFVRFGEALALALLLASRER